MIFQFYIIIDLIMSLSVDETDKEPADDRMVISLPDETSTKCSQNCINCFDLDQRCDQNKLFTTGMKQIPFDEAIVPIKDQEKLLNLLDSQFSDTNSSFTVESSFVTKSPESYKNQSQIEIDDFKDLSLEDDKMANCIIKEIQTLKIEESSSLLSYVPSFNYLNTSEYKNKNGLNCLFSCLKIDSVDLVDFPVEFKATRQRFIYNRIYKDRMNNSRRMTYSSYFHMEIDDHIFGVSVEVEMEFKMKSNLSIKFNEVKMRDLISFLKRKAINMVAARILLEGKMNKKDRGLGIKCKCDIKRGMGIKMNTKLKMNVRYALKAEGIKDKFRKAERINVTEDEKIVKRRFKRDYKKILEDLNDL